MCTHWTASSASSRFPSRRYFYISMFFFLSYFGSILCDKANRKGRPTILCQRIAHAHSRDDGVGISYLIIRRLFWNPSFLNRKWAKRFSLPRPFTTASNNERKIYEKKACMWREWRKRVLIHAFRLIFHNKALSSHNNATRALSFAHNTLARRRVRWNACRSGLHKKEEKNENVKSERRKNKYERSKKKKTVDGDVCRDLNGVRYIVIHPSLLFTFAHRPKRE